MFIRSAFGLASLTIATSCVAPASQPGPETVRVTRTAPGPLRAPAAIPPGPPLALLANAGPVDLAAIVSVTPAPAFAGATASPPDARRALDCLTAAVYYEARSESVAGQEAVAQVVLNRVRNPAYPASVCGTVYEGAARGSGCQFTFTCDGSTAARREPAAWERARQVAQAALAGFVYAPVGAATYYHTTAVRPYWAAKVTRVAEIGAHIFYRLPGAWGTSLAYRQAYGGSEPALSVGAHVAEKATPDLIEAIEAGVRVHRGAEAAAAAGEPVAALATVTRAAGVMVHRGSLPSGPVSATHVDHGVTVHVKADDDAAGA